MQGAGGVRQIEIPYKAKQSRYTTWCAFGGRGGIASTHS
jgi:hypothetical protein